MDYSTPLLVYANDGSSRYWVSEIPNKETRQEDWCWWHRSYYYNDRSKAVEHLERLRLEPRCRGQGLSYMSDRDAVDL